MEKKLTLDIATISSCKRKDTRKLGRTDATTSIHFSRNNCVLKQPAFLKKIIHSELINYKDYKGRTLTLKMILVIGEMNIHKFQENHFSNLDDKTTAQNRSYYSKLVKESSISCNRFKHKKNCLSNFKSLELFNIAACFGYP